MSLERFRKSVVPESRIRNLRAVVHIANQRLTIMPQGVNTVEGLTGVLQGTRIFDASEVEGASAAGVVNVVVSFDGGWVAFIRSGK